MGKKKQVPVVVEEPVIEEEELMEADDDGEEFEEEGGQENGKSGSRRGRPKGKRPIFFCCAGLVGGQLKVSFYPMTLPDNAEARPDLEAGRAEAMDLFMEEYGEKPSFVENKGIYFYQGLQSKPRSTTTIRRKEGSKYRWNGETALAEHIFKGIRWEVAVNYLTNENICMIQYRSPIDSPVVTKGDKKVRIQPPISAYINPKELTNVKSMD